MNLLILIIYDTMMVFIALWLAYFLRVESQSFLGLARINTDMWHYTMSGSIFVLAILLNYFFDLYTKRNDFWEETRQIFKVSSLILFSVLMIVFLDKASSEYSRLIFIFFFVNLLWALPLGRLLAKKMMLALGLWKRSIWIDASDDDAQQIKKTIVDNWYLGYDIVDKLDNAKIVFVMSNTYTVLELSEKIHDYKRNKKEVVLIPNIYNLSFSQGNVINLLMGRMSLVQIQNQLFKSKNIFLKTLTEVLLIILLLPIISIVLLILAAVVKFDSKGSILFKQARLGRDEKVFSCYKFRTMYEDGAVKLEKYLDEHPNEKAYYEIYHKYQNDPRITPSGRWLRKLSLDELPQIINILKGEMHLVGPRPYMVEEKVKLANDTQTILHIAPGITGFWQVGGRNEVDFKQRIAMDKWYIQNWTIWLDFVIFLKTFLVLFNRKGAK